MFDLKKIEAEIKYVKNVFISNEEELKLFQERYLSKKGILPDIYESVVKTKGDKGDFFLMKMIELRHEVDAKVKRFNQSH
jgi:hypothetical protein